MSANEVEESIKNSRKKHEERMKRLRNLHAQRNEARQLNHIEVVEEDRRSKLPSNWEARKQRAQWVLDDEAAREEAKSKGEDYDRIKLLNIPANVCEKIEKKNKRKMPDEGFSDFEQAAIRKYNRLIRNHKVDIEAYNEQKEKLGAAMYNGPNPVLLGIVNDSSTAIDHMVDDLEKQIIKRDKYSRRRMHNDDTDIDYINERNMKFNKKLERFYGAHTAEIKQNLERGTAV
ncbi:hypothetical protein RUM44_005401 [Polyplax serrata]|uniref:Pre-mRNA-splicing factor SYF2 n=1 Tax=Polyplax serrata TaxID=468196 RepID=A0ABR1AEQ8_POLSC